MSEAIFSKYSKSLDLNNITSSISSRLISNATKATLGVPNSGTLDDCLSMLSLKDPSYATIQVTLQDVDGTPLQGHQLRMTQANGANLTYTTDGAGQCIFKTQTGQATIRDGFTNYAWFDVNAANPQTIDCPVGTVKQITMKRYKTLFNGYNCSFGCTTQWVNISKFANVANITIKGHSGQGGMPAFPTNAGLTCCSTQANNINVYFNNDHGCGIYVVTYINYTFNPSLSSFSQGYSRNQYYGGTITINNSTFLGGGGEPGNLITHNNVSIGGTNWKITASPGSLHESESVNISLYNSGEDSSYRQVYVSARSSTFIQSNKSSLGATGATISAFGYTVGGGRGGKSKTRDNITSSNWSGISGCGQESRTFGVYNINSYTDASGETWVYSKLSGTIEVKLHPGESVNGYVCLNNFRYK